MELMSELLFLSTAITPLTTALLEVVKKMIHIKEKNVPVVAIFIGMVLSASSGFILEVELYPRIWIGLISGLASVGLFEVSKHHEEEGGL